MGRSGKARSTRSGTSVCRTRIKGLYDCVKALSKTDFSENLKKVPVPQLIVARRRRSNRAADDSRELSSKFMPNAKLKIYEGAPYGMRTAHADRVNADLLEFLQL
jgi:non-heme chloroperoxidase